MTSDKLKSARFAAGRARWRRHSSVRKLKGIPRTFAVGPRPEVGSQPSHTENTRMSISPTQKVGSENPRIEPAMMVLPAADRGARPAQSPRGIPSRTAIIIAALASSSVAGMRSRIRPIAGTLKAKDLPRSPLAACATKTKYCSMSGRSSPSAAVARAISFWSDCGLTRMSTGFPTAYTPANTSSDMTNSTATLCARRRTQRASIGGLRGATARSIPADLMSQREFVRARRVSERLSHRPGRDLVMQRDNRVVPHGEAHRVAGERLALLLVHARKSALEQRIDVPIRVTRPVECAEALVRVGGCDKCAQGEVRGERAPAEHRERELPLSPLGQVRVQRQRLDARAHANAREHLRHGLRDLLVVDVAVV